MVFVNPLSALLWSLRRSERDVVKLYGAMSPMMQAAAGCDMLNFGLWDGAHHTPQSAQANLCARLASMAGLQGAQLAIDVGSGLSAPAAFWKEGVPGLEVCCINTSFAQLRDSESRGVPRLNATAGMLPLADSCADRVLALESPQHFRPLGRFFSESARVLRDSGVLALAVPVTTAQSPNLGILRITWASEHYTMDHVRGEIAASGLEVAEEKMVGGSVYGPLARYYMENRDRIGPLVSAKYSWAMERVLCKSLKKMAQCARAGVIEYALVSCRKARA